ncbi:MAG: glycosyltransferase family 39 protein [Desulfomonilaceae bacterium]
MNSSPPASTQITASPRYGLLTVWLLAGLAAVFVWRVFFTGSVNLIPDECSYWTWSRRLDWSYFDNSGMTAYLIRLSTALFGDQTPFSVRFPFLVLSGLTTYLTYRVSQLLFQSRSRAILAATLFNLTPIALLGGSAAIHDNALLFFWVLALWAAASFLRSGDLKKFYVMGAATGLAIQSKYTGVLILPSVLLLLLWSKPHCGLLLKKEPWIGVLIAVAFTMPIIWWNATHQWASLHHIFYIGAGAASLGKRILDGLGYHVAQFLLLSPLLYFALLVGLFTALARNLVRPNPEQALLLCFGLPLLLFGLLAFKGHVEANWAFMAYPSIVILAVEIIATARQNEPKAPWKWFGARFLKWAVVLSVGPILLVLAHAWLGLLPAGLEKKLGKDDRIIWETRGWAGLGKHVSDLKSDGDVIAADSYQLCALLEFNMPGNPQVRYLAPWKRPTQFDVWEPSFDNLKGRNILFVSPKPLNPTSAVLTTIYENFSRVEPLAPYNVMYHGVAIRQIYIYRGYKFDPFSPRRLGPRSLLYKDYQL